MAWHVKNSDSQPHLIGEKKPNALGIHDMLGPDYRSAKTFAGNCGPFSAAFLGLAESAEQENPTDGQGGQSP